MRFRVSQSGYFAWKDLPASRRQREDIVLLAARLVRLDRGILQSSAAPFRPRVHHSRTGGAPSRLIRRPPSRGKVSSRLNAILYANRVHLT